MPSKIDFSKPIQAWRREPFGQRLDTCRFLLYAHGFLSESENIKVKARLKKAADAAKEKGK